MDLSKLTYHKTKLLNWIFAVFLFISLLSFQGLTAKSQFSKQAPSQNELILCKTSELKDKPSNIKIYFFVHEKSIKENSYKSHFGRFIIIHNTLAKVLYAHISENVFAYKPFSGLYINKLIHLAAEGDSAHPSRG